MNARQKAKKYKHMYEALLKQQPVRFKVEQHKIDTLKCERLYPEALITQENSSQVRGIIVRDIAQSIVSNLDKYIEYHTEFCPHINKYRFYGEIDVVDRL